MLIFNQNKILHKTTAIFLVVLYTVAMLKSFTPFIEYAVNYDYISTVLCVNKDEPRIECNGKCHLVKEVEKQQKEEKSVVNIDLKEYPIGFVEIIQFNKTMSFFIKKKEKLFSDYQNYSFLAVSSFFHPPRSLTGL